MKTTYIFLAFIAILMYNVLLIQRDQKMFQGYDSTIENVKPQSKVTE